MLEKSFVHLHNHSEFSFIDGSSSLKSMAKLANKYRMPAIALTDHGNGSGLAHARKHTEKMQKAGRKYRQLYGCEFYFVPSLSDWRNDYEDHRQAVRDAKSEKKALERTSIDADEELSAKLQRSILKLKSEGLKGVYDFSRLTNYCGSWIKYSGWYPDIKTRIFPKEQSKWMGDVVHETLDFPSTLSKETLNASDKIEGIDSGVFSLSLPSIILIPSRTAF